MTDKTKFRSLFLIVAALLLGLPLVGILLLGQPLGQYTEFPPLTQYVEHAPFAWPVFVALAIVIMAVVLPFDLHAIRMRKQQSIINTQQAMVNSHPFPAWGWLGVLVMGTAWFLAWTRFSWFAPFQVFTFSPLWFGYIIIINALTHQRTGRCMLRNRPGHFNSLCLASAGFWWFFEYLNRFVQNWHYVGIGSLTPAQYFVFATLPFSTVLPAVLGTYEYLDSIPRVGCGLDSFVGYRPSHPKLAAAIVLALSCAATACIGVWPDVLFPMLWVSPLLVIVSIQALRGRETLFSPIANGNWRRIYLLAASALVCGFFWEMWNYHSVAKWIYLVPYVNRFKIFEMPVLGYAGYLPFGLECAVIADMLVRRRS